MDSGGDAVVAFAPCGVASDVFRRNRWTETNGDRRATGGALVDRPGDETAVNIDGNDRYRSLLDQRADAGKKALQLSIPAASPFRKPDEIEALVKKTYATPKPVIDRIAKLIQ